MTVVFYTNSWCRIKQYRNHTILLPNKSGREISRAAQQRHKNVFREELLVVSYDVVLKLNLCLKLETSDVAKWGSLFLTSTIKTGVLI